MWQILELKDKVKDKELKKDLKTIAKEAMTTVQGGAVTNQSINQLRRREIRFGLDEIFRPLCAKPEEESEVLLGGNLPAKVKQLTEMENVGNDLTKRKKREPFKSHFKSRYYIHHYDLLVIQNEETM